MCVFVYVCIGQVPLYGFSVTAVDAGLLSTLIPSQTTLSWFLKTPDGSGAAGIGVILPYTSTGQRTNTLPACHNTNALIYRLLLTGTENIQCVCAMLCADPVPGACNQEFALDIDPNIYLLYNLFETTITFAPANIGYER